MLGPEPVEGGDVEHDPAAVDGLGHGVGVTQVAVDHLDVEPFEVGHVPPGLDQRHHSGTAVRASSRATDGADEPGRTGDQHPVAGLAGSRRARRCGHERRTRVSASTGVRRRPRRVLRAIDVPTSTSSPELRWASARTSSRAVTNWSISSSPMISGWQQLDDVHVVRRHLGQDPVPVEQRDHDELGEQPLAGQLHHAEAGPAAARLRRTERRGRS